jgi:hypothetical protein
MTAPRAICLALLLITTVPSLAGAQTASPSEMAAARDLFEEGIEAARAEEWERARELFERSYRVVPRSSTLLNLASAQAETGQLIHAAESYRRFIAEAGGDQAELAASAEEALADVEARLARVTISIEGLEANDEVWLDEQVIGHGSLGIDLPVNPGEHVVTVARAGAAVGEQSFTVGEGESREVAVAASSSPAEDAVDPIALPDPEMDDGEGSSIWSSPWLWVGVGLAVAAAVLIPILVVSSSTDAPHMGSLGSGSLAFQ